MVYAYANTTKKNTIQLFVANINAARTHEFYGNMLVLLVKQTDVYATVYNCNDIELRMFMVKEPNLLPFTKFGWIALDIRAIDSQGDTFAKYTWDVMDELGVWTTPGNK